MRNHLDISCIDVRNESIPANLKYYASSFENDSIHMLLSSKVKKVPILQGSPSRHPLPLSHHMAFHFHYRYGIATACCGYRLQVAGRHTAVSG
ncbi:predicted protein [Lichtheimia corymbifera JMRC:FSU:9682]|uniref:Uncharacterized protein n=1 Tax=Lichtheimia corymbifera JMRC:FSU:9682 TaxID=1263082 RepID=A0A068S6I3_9FUNG|nr:predicted protein [Lichtheimia corymbifera JMRC:FSU:9682]